MSQLVRSVDGASTVTDTVGVLPTLSVTSFPVVRHVGTVVGRAVTVTLTSMSVWNIQTSVATTPSASTLTVPTPANVIRGTTARETAANVRYNHVGAAAWAGWAMHPKFWLGWATVHFAPPIIGLCVR